MAGSGSLFGVEAGADDVGGLPGLDLSDVSELARGDIRSGPIPIDIEPGAAFFRGGGDLLADHGIAFQVFQVDEVLSFEAGLDGINQFRAGGGLDENVGIPEDKGGGFVAQLRESLFALGGDQR